MLNRLGAFFLDVLEVVVGAIALFLFIYLLVMQPHKIKGSSMYPNFQDGEYLLTDKISYRFGTPKRGDVIVFDAPVAEGEEYIKRIIGLPGETVSVRNGNVYVNNQQLDEKYLPSGLQTQGNMFLQDGQTTTVPTGEYFVMGDNRANSSDSRVWGFVTTKEITGKAWFVYWPLNLAGSVTSVSYTN
jgi:signal peptidase I